MDSPLPLADALDGTAYVLCEGLVFETEYLRVPDEHTRADDIVLEARNGEDELWLTRDDVDAAQSVGEGVWRLRDGTTLRLLEHVTLH
ncbi:MAG: hypothetical protein BroJett026_28070 [Betaproteobacteria bacterium]|nr:MAG: hypothetical protein BroJett026_28070 [Betaproteobacteria bacterium]